MTAFPLPPNATIGLVGGGQLGRMSALAAARLGYRCHILTREADSPAAQVSHAATVGDYGDPDALRAFAAAVDVISFEFENVDAAGLELLASLKPVRPGPGVLRISQNRVAEKTFLNAAGAATAQDGTGNAMRDILMASQKEKKGVTLYVAGQTIAMVVTMVGLEFVEGRNREMSKIVVKLTSIDAAAIA